MMAAILNSAILDSAILHKTWLIYSDSTWFKQPSWILHLSSFSQTHSLDDGKILNSAILDSHLHKKTSFIHSDSTWWLQISWYLPSCIQPFCTKKTSLIHSDSTWLWQPSWILSSWIQPFCTKLWLKLLQSHSNSFILTQLDDISHLEFCHVGFRHCHLGFRHLVISSQIHSKTLSLQSDSVSN